MRLIGSIDNESEAIKFSHFLTEKSVHHHVDTIRNQDWGSDSYGIIDCQFWIDDEDHVDEALQWIAKFQENPNDSLFSSTPPSLPTAQPSELKEEISQWEKIPMGIITRIILATCCLLFIATEFFTPSTPLTGQAASLPIFSSPIERALLYDYPSTYELIGKLIHLYGEASIEHPDQLPSEGKFLLEKINQTPYWQGIYEYTIEHRLDSLSKVPLFEKIREGEIWRLFTPCLLHGSLLHIFFNMLWLLIVGKQLESRLLPFRYVVFILITGIISNTAQYLMSGPNFIGFSGVLAAMIGFIWIRQREAPWESYQLDRATLMFVSVFVFGLATLQTLVFIMQYFFYLDISFGIANTAHLTGAATGIAFGKLSYFKWK